MNIQDLRKEQNEMKKSFSREVMKAAFSMFGGDRLIWNHANGVKIAHAVNASSRIFNFSENKMLYDITAPMQMGKSTATMAMIAELMNLNTDKDFIICYYLCTSNKSVVEQFRNEAHSFFKSLDHFGLSSTDEYLSIFFREQTTKIVFVHNTSSTSLKKRAIAHINAIDDDDTVKILLFDEADQALGRDSKRDQFMQSILGVENAYDHNAMTIRQNKQLIEFWIGATNFFNYYKGITHFEKMYSRIDLLEHPDYYGLLKMMENACVFEKEENDIKDILEKFCNSSEEYEQYGRPVAFVRIRNGNKESKSFYEENILNNVGRKSAFTTDYNEFSRLKADDYTEVITVHFNGDKSFSHCNLETLLRELDCKTRMSKKQNANFKKLRKKIVVIICGTLKEGNSILNKNSQNLSFLWESITEKTKKFEGPLQQAGRICKIGIEDPPLLFASKKLIDVLQKYIHEHILPDGERIRWTKNKNKFALTGVEKVLFMKEDGFKNHIEARKHAKIKAMDLGIEITIRYGRFKKKDHQEQYRNRIYPAAKYWFEGDFIDKGQISIVHTAGKSTSCDSICYIEEISPENFGYRLIYLVGATDDEYIQNYAEINSDKCSLMKYEPLSDSINVVESDSKLSMLSVV